MNKLHKNETAVGGENCPSKPFTLGADDVKNFWKASEDGPDALIEWWAAAGERMGFVYSTVDDIEFVRMPYIDSPMGPITGATFTAWPAYDGVEPDPEFEEWALRLAETDPGNGQEFTRENLAAAFNAGRIRCAEKMAQLRMPVSVTENAEMSPRGDISDAEMIEALLRTERAHFEAMIVACSEARTVLDAIGENRAPSVSATVGLRRSVNLMQKLILEADFDFDGYIPDMGAPLADSAAGGHEGED